jgi:hypothetical protein
MKGKPLFKYLKTSLNSRKNLMLFFFFCVILLIAISKFNFLQSNELEIYSHIKDNNEDDVYLFQSSQYLNDKMNEAKWIDTTLITFKDTFEFYLDSGMVWKIKNETDSIIYRGIGGIDQMTFPIPGKYLLDLTQPTKFGRGLFSEPNIPINHDLCNHSPFPDELVILVSDTHLKFDFSTISFNKELSAGANNDVILTIDGYYEQFSDRKLNFEDIDVIASGVEANMTSKAPKVNSQLINGNYTFSFQLSGNLKRDTYIQLDFYVPNQKSQSYYHLNKIQ